MLNLLVRYKFYNGRFYSVDYFPSADSAHKFFLLQLSPFSSSAANSRKPRSGNANQDSFVANYLKNICGFSPERALMYSKHVGFDSSERPDSVFAFFKNHHFSDAQITVIVRKWPLVFNCVPESNFGPKIEFFHSLGFSSSDIARVLTLDPNLLGRSLEGQVIPCVDFLRSFLCSDKDVIFSIMRYPGIIRQNLQDILLPNVEILRGAGVPDSHIAALLKAYPRGIAVDHKRFRVTVEEVEKLGFNPRKKMFIIGIMVMRRLSSSTWKEKIGCYERWGLSEHQVMDAFKKFPYFMVASKDRIARVMDLLINKMACDISVLTTRPEIVLLSFEKRIAPRCAFYQILLSKGLIKQGFSLGAMLKCPRRLFLERYVQRFEKKDPELLKLYQEIFGNSKA